jgi:ribosomal protein S1
MDINIGNQINNNKLNPDDMVELKVGHIIKGIVEGVDKKLIRVLLGSKMCYLPVSEISWTGKKSRINEKDEIEAVVVKIQEDANVLLSIKRMLDDPWEKVQERFHVGMKVQGKIQLAQQYGLIIDLGDSITTLLHYKTVGLEKDVNWFDYILIGNVLEVEIYEIDLKSRKVYVKCDNFLNQYPKRNK